MVKIETLDFLRDLAANNRRDWFHANKERYDNAKQNVLDITRLLTEEVGKFDPSVRAFDPKKGMFRIARDNRFWPNRDPYKTNFGTCINSRGKDIVYNSTYYLNIEPENCFVSAGVYMPVKEALQDVRYHIYNNFDRFEQIITYADFVKAFGGLAHDKDKLKRVPDSFDKNHPAAEFMKMKNYFAFRLIPDEIIVDEKVALEYILHSIRLLMPLNTFINEAFGKDRS